jgi:5-methylcytosine-specific restriction enzyme subunit McrC
LAPNFYCEFESVAGNFVIDTKWKILKERRPSGADLKQIFVYNLHHESALGILLYPKTVLESAGKKPNKKEFSRDTYCQVAFADLFNIEGKLEKKLGHKLYDELLKTEIERFD